MKTLFFKIILLTSTLSLLPAAENLIEEIPEVPLICPRLPRESQKKLAYAAGLKGATRTDCVARLFFTVNKNNITLQPHERTPFFHAVAHKTGEDKSSCNPTCESQWNYLELRYPQLSPRSQIWQDTFLKAKAERNAAQ